jgi:ATP-binding protein involved in chromosome partitioning
VPFLGRVPIDPAIREGGDSGTPIVVANPMSPQSAAFREIAQKIIAEVSGASKGVPPIESLLSKIKNPFAKT